MYDKIDDDSSTEGEYWKLRDAFDKYKWISKDLISHSIKIGQQSRGLSHAKLKLLIFQGH